MSRGDGDVGGRRGFGASREADQRVRRFEELDGTLSRSASQAMYRHEVKRGTVTLTNQKFDKDENETEERIARDSGPKRFRAGVDF